MREKVTARSPLWREGEKVCVRERREREEEESVCVRVCKRKIERKWHHEVSWGEKEREGEVAVRER